jgi:DNA-directed RNA polymerase subunit RPC12/RpoP
METGDTIRCPNCGRRDVRPSHAKGLKDAVMSALRRQPFRCRACGSRFYVRGAAKEAKSEAKPESNDSKRATGARVGG